MKFYVHMIGARCADLIAEAVLQWNLKHLLKIFKNVSCASNFGSNEAALAATDNRALHVIRNLN
jgi:dihydrolipoamide dehydrogenase